MTWFGWLLVAFFVLNSIMAILFVGKIRTPSKPGEVVITVIINALLLLGVLLIGTNNV